MGSNPTCSIIKSFMAPQKKEHTAAQISGLISAHQLKECPSCGELKSKVKESRKVFDGTRRRYACLSCDYKYTTYEVSSVIYEELRSLRAKFSQLQSIFGEVSPPLQQVITEPAVAEPTVTQPDGIPCCDCVHITSYGCSFDIPEAQTEDARDCNLFQAIISDNMLT